MFHVVMFQLTRCCWMFTVCVCDETYFIMRVMPPRKMAQKTQRICSPPTVLKTQSHTSPWQLRDHSSRRREASDSVSPHGQRARALENQRSALLEHMPVWETCQSLTRHTYKHTEDAGAHCSSHSSLLGVICWVHVLVYMSVGGAKAAYNCKQQCY